MKWFVLLLLKAYKAILSPLLPPACRFEPTCSVYMMQAVQRFGVVSGVWMGLKRLSHCHPGHPGGLDPVPELPHPEQALVPEVATGLEATIASPEPGASPEQRG